MTFLYRIAIAVYHFMIWTAAPFNGKARLYVSGRKNWAVKLQRQAELNSRYIWIHCASLGEFEQGRPVIEAIRQEHPEYRIVLSFFSPSGFEVRKKYPFADIVCYLPRDSARNAKRFLDIIKPEKALFIKYEFWYYYIRELKNREIPLYLISGIFRKEQMFFSAMPWGIWFRNLLNSFTMLYIQDNDSAKLLENAGIRKFTIAGDTRFDRVAALSESAKDIPVVNKFAGNKPLLVAGSTWTPDEQLLCGIINNQDRFKLIIAPHEVTPENVSKLEKMLKKPSVRYTLANEADVHQYSVLIIDTIGLLSSLYRYGKIAYIGGGFGVGIHNILEAATYGMPVIFGPNYARFREARDLIGLKAAFPVGSAGELEKVLSVLTGEPSVLQEASEISSNYVNKNKGATKVIIDQIFK